MGIGNSSINSITDQSSAPVSQSPISIPPSSPSDSSKLNLPQGHIKIDSSVTDTKNVTKWKCPFAPKKSNPLEHVPPSTSSENPESQSKCPVRHNSNIEKSVEKELPRKTENTTSTTTDSKCPIKQKNENSSTTSSWWWGNASSPTSGYKSPEAYNVYSQKIDPNNMMPSTPIQVKAPGQSVDLSTQRIKSEIPKAGTDSDTWLYPSPQMFWNAMVRKNKSKGAQEEDMDIVVSIHNNMNEKTWKQVLAWEQLHPNATNDEGKQPKLLRFLGRPHDLSPKATLKKLCGHPTPFDRHDWFIDRGGKQIRYVIDYYHDESYANSDKKPEGLHDAKSIQSIQLDVRPAVDSWEALLDRILVMPYYRFLGKSTYNPPPFFPPKKMIEAETKKQQHMQESLNNIILQCNEAKNNLENCQSEEDCGARSIALRRCTAKVVCPAIVKEFDACIAKSPIDEKKLNHAYLGMENCLDQFEVDVRATIPVK